ncbi:MAG: hypothetical protein KGJ06_01850 [Pseudomonadota bacterium]|nr:hypothetical protein [Pseudomonadota bacterium]
MLEISPAGSNIEQLRAVTRKMLTRLEGWMDRPVPRKRIDARQQAHDWLFGKASLMETLMMLVEVMLKLEQAGIMPPAQDASFPSPELSPADVALVEAFIARLRAAQALPPAR